MAAARGRALAVARYRRARRLLRASDAVSQMRGAMNAGSVAQPEAFQRANYLKVLGSYAPAGAPAGALTGKS
jgi:hypothetical protein